MGVTYEYILSLQDKMSGVMKAVTGASEATISKLSALSDKAKALQGAVSDLGNGIFSLRERIDLLRQERDLLHPSNLDSIKQYNREIARLEGQITRLENAGTGGSFGGMMDRVKSFINPYTIGAAALGFLGKSALDFDQGMAKINITAQLDKKGLNDLRDKLQKIAKDNKEDVTVAPTSFEKIISQTGDVEMSLNVLDAAMKGAKASGADLDMVAGALAQTMSILGKNADALEVLDTFFAGKRVGAGEFEDFATYMPGLIAMADSLGVKYKAVTGIFAYMTGKGQDAARAAVLMGNLFSALSKTDITKNLEKVGVKVFDVQGKMRGMVDIFSELGTLMFSMSDKQKTAFLEKIGIVDKEAKSAFAIMGNDLDKLQIAMNATADATGETADALEYSKSVMQKVIGIWNKFKEIGNNVGFTLLPVINIGLDGLAAVLSATIWSASKITSLFTSWFSALSDGSPLIWGITAALGAYVMALGVYELYINRAVIATKLKLLWDGIASVATKVWTGVQWGLNTAFLACPLTWIIGLIVGLIAAIVACVLKVEGWGRQWQVIVSFMKNIFDLFVENLKFQWSILTDGFLNGLDKVKRGWYQFKEAVGLGDSTENQRMIASLTADIDARNKALRETAGKIEALREKTLDSFTWELSWKEGENTLPLSSGLPGEVTSSTTKTTPDTQDFDQLMRKIGNKTGGGSKGSSLDLNYISDYKGTSAYSAIVSRLSPVHIPSLSRMAAMAAIPLAVAGADPSASMPETDKTEYAEHGKSITMERFCDQIVINIASADGKGQERIRQEIVSVIEEVFDNYEA